MTSEEYKKLSLKEFDRAAEKFDDDDPSVYNLYHDRKARGRNLHARRFLPLCILLFAAG